MSGRPHGTAVPSCPYAQCSHSGTHGWHRMHSCARPCRGLDVLYNCHGCPWLFVHGMRAQPRPQPGSHAPQTAFPQQRGAPALQSHCLPLSLSSGSAPCCPPLWCNQASTVLQAAREALEPPGHIHLSAAVHYNSCTRLLGSLSRRTVLSVLSTEQCPHPGLAAAHKAEQATRAATGNGADPTLDPSPSIIWGCPINPCIAERRKA